MNVELRFIFYPFQEPPYHQSLKNAQNHKVNQLSLMQSLEIQIVFVGC